MELSRLDRHTVKAGEQHETDEAGVDGPRLWGRRQVHPETARVAETTDSLAKSPDVFRFTRIRPCNSSAEFEIQRWSNRTTSFAEKQDHPEATSDQGAMLRRGKPTVHVAYGEATAMLVGDALQAFAFEALAGALEGGASPAAVVEMTRVLAAAAGSVGMAGGQAIDLQAVGTRLSREALEDMHQRKTGAMLAASVRLGAACGRPLTGDQRTWLDVYARSIGLAFQVVDDILDVVGEAATLGKTAGKDAQQGKPTYVSVLGLPASRQLADELLARARQATAALGSGARRLDDIAGFIVSRQS